MTTSSSGKRVFTLELVRGCQPNDLCRLIHDKPFVGSMPDGPEFSDGIHRHTRVLTVTEASAIINDDIKQGKGTVPICDYVEKI